MPAEDHDQLAQDFASRLPDISSVKGQADQFWNQIPVRSERIAASLKDPEYLQGHLYLFDVPLLQALCIWTCSVQPLSSNRPELIKLLTEKISAEPDNHWCKDLFCIIETVRGQRHHAIEMISRSLLPAEVYEFISGSPFIDNSKRLAYAMMLYYQEPHNLHLMRLYEHAERAGYTRYTLIPRAFEGDQPVSEETAEQAEREIERGEIVSSLSKELLDVVLEKFEARRGGRRKSRCLGIHLMDGDQLAIVFILRQFRENYIQEVDRTIFGDEAQLIVLRLWNQLRNLEEHSKESVGAAKSVGAEIAGEIASQLLRGAAVEYEDDQTKTSRVDLDRLLGTLKKNQDEILHLQEVYLHRAPLDGTPQLILRCDKEDDLTVPLAYLEQRNIQLLGDLDNLRRFKIVYKREISPGKAKSYIFLLILFRAINDNYFVRYSQHVAPTPTRREFESYLKEKYGVRITPQTGKTPDTAGTA